MTLVIVTLNASVGISLAVVLTILTVFVCTHLAATDDPKCFFRCTSDISGVDGGGVCQKWMGLPEKYSKGAMAACPIYRMRELRDDPLTHQRDNKGWDQ